MALSLHKFGSAGLAVGVVKFMVRNQPARVPRDPWTQAQPYACRPIWYVHSVLLCPSAAFIAAHLPPALIRELSKPIDGHGHNIQHHMSFSVDLPDPRDLAPPRQVFHLEQPEAWVVGRIAIGYGLT